MCVVCWVCCVFVCFVYCAVLCSFVVCCVLFVFRCVLCTVYCVLCVGRPLWQMEEQWMKMRGNRFNRSRPLPAHRNINDHRVTQIHVSPFPLFEDNHWKGNHFPEEPIFPFIIGSKTGGMLGSYTSSVALISEKKRLVISKRWMPCVTFVFVLCNTSWAESSEVDAWQVRGTLRARRRIWLSCAAQLWTSPGDTMCTHRNIQAAPRCGKI